MAILKTGLSWATTSGAAEHSGSEYDANDHNIAIVDPQQTIRKFIDWILQLVKAIDMQKKERSVEERSSKSDNKENNHELTNEEIVRRRDQDVARKEYERAEDVPRASELYKGEGKGKGKGKREFNEAKYGVEGTYESISKNTKRCRLPAYQWDAIIHRMTRASAREHALQNEREAKCFRAALEMRFGLTTEQAELLQELYERLATIWASAREHALQNERESSSSEQR